MHNDEVRALQPHGMAEAPGSKRPWIALACVMGALLGLMLLADAAARRLRAGPEDRPRATATGRLLVPLDWPDFTLTTEDQRRLSLRDLRGSVWIADVLSLQCTVCPPLSGRIAEVQERLQSKSVRFVSFSIDPSVKSATLAQHRAKYRRADPQRWTLLQADLRQVPRLLVWLDMAATEDLARALLCTLRPRFFLVDHQGRLRGSYDAEIPEQLVWLAHDADDLVLASEASAPAAPQPSQGDIR